MACKSGYTVHVICMNETDLAWAAGFLDGEGCFTLAKATTRRNGKEWVGYRCGIGANQAIYSEPIKFLHESFGGTIFIRGQKTVTGKTVYQWRIGAKEARNILPSIIPYLRVKHDQAKYVLEFAQISRRVGCKGFVPEQAAIREEIYQRFLQTKIYE